MSRTSLADHNCSFAKAVEILGDKWTLMVLRDAFYGVTSFNGFRKRLGIAPTVLSDRLQKLCDAQVLTRQRPKPEVERFTYRLTDAGRALFPTMIALLQWGDRYISGPGNEPVTIFDERHRAPVQPVAVQARDGRYLTTADISFGPGPGAEKRSRN